MQTTIGTGTVSVEFLDVDFHGRAVFRWTVSIPAGEFTGDDLRSGCGVNMEERDGMESLLSFLSAAAEAYSYSQRTGRESDNGDLFPAPVMEWCYQNSGELDCAALEFSFFEEN